MRVGSRAPPCALRYPGSTRGRLAAVKSRYHPDNAFCVNQSISPAGSPSRSASVLLISRRVEPGHASALLEGGAEGAGCLLEARVSVVSRFIEAVHDVAARRSVLDPEVLTRLFDPQRRDPLIDGLSDRDREVLAQIAAGVSNRGIARRMFLSERAIERHVTTIFDTLGITTASHANRRVLAVLAHLRAAAPA